MSVRGEVSRRKGRILGLISTWELWNLNGPDRLHPNTEIMAASARSVCG